MPISPIQDMTGSGRSVTTILSRKAKRQYLITLQVSRHCLLTLQGGISSLLLNARVEHQTHPH